MSVVLAGEQLELFDGAGFHYLRQQWPCKACDGMPVTDPDLKDAPEEIRKYFGADPCLGWLPGVRHACCGHGGRRGNPVLGLRDGRTLVGNEALAKMRELGGSPP